MCFNLMAMTGIIQYFCYRRISKCSLGLKQEGRVLLLMATLKQAVMHSACLLQLDTLKVQCPTKGRVTQRNSVAPC